MGWVKFWPFLWGAATLYLVMRLAQRLGGGWFATALAGTCYLGTAFARLNLLFQPNSFEVFGFVFCLYWLVRYVQEERPRYLYLLGLGLGLGLLNKYTTLFFIAALGGALLLTPWRRLLLNRHFWGAAGLALLLWLPNLAWQISHGIPFLHHMRCCTTRQLVHVEAADFWKAAAADVLRGAVGVGAGPAGAAAGPAVAALPGGGLGGGAGRGPAGRAARQRLLRLGLLPGAVQLWGVVVGAAASGSLAARAAGVAWRPVLQAGAGGACRCCCCCRCCRSSTRCGRRPPWRPCAPRYQHLGLYRWEDGQNHALPQDYADMLGWRELADKTWAAYQALPDSVRAHTLIHCANYGQASAINYYNRHRALPLANSFNGSFLYWYPAPRTGQAVLIIDDEPDDELAPHFAAYRRVGAVADPYAREQGTAITLGLQPDECRANT